MSTEVREDLELVNVVESESSSATASPSTSSRNGSSASTRRERYIPTPPDRPNPNPDRSPAAFDSIIEEAAERYEMPFSFIKAVIRVESSFDPYAVSHVGASGLMQLMPGTAEEMGCRDTFDPRDNIMAGTRYLRRLSDRYNGDINLVLAAYNAGSGNVSRYDGIPFAATRRYVERVYGYYNEYRLQYGE